MAFAEIRVDISSSGLREIVNSREIGAALQGLGDQIAQEAKRTAPRDTGEGAESIHAEVVRGEEGQEARISWDQKNFYMVFHEFGTRYIRPKSFLRAALTRRYRL